LQCLLFFENAGGVSGGQFPQNCFRLRQNSASPLPFPIIFFFHPRAPALHNRNDTPLLPTASLGSTPMATWMATTRPFLVFVTKVLAHDEDVVRIVADRVEFRGLSV
jgi:hypothetical protein